MDATDDVFGVATSDHSPQYHDARLTRALRSFTSTLTPLTGPLWIPTQPQSCRAPADLQRTGPGSSGRRQPSPVGRVSYQQLLLCTNRCPNNLVELSTGVLLIDQSLE